MPVPKERHSKKRQRQRRAQHDKMEPPAVTLCQNPQCGAPMLAHHLCPECGTVRRKDGTFLQVMKSREEILKTKEEKRAKAKAKSAPAAK